MPKDLPVKSQSEANCLEACSDEELAVLAKGDDAFAMEILVERYKVFVRSCSQSYFLMGADREDIIQEGMIGLYKAIMSFQAEKEASFKTFACLCIKRQILTAVKMSARKKHLPLNTYVSIHKEESGALFLEHIGYTGKTHSENPEQLIIEQEDMKDAQDQIDKVLSAFEAEVLIHHLAGVPYGEIASRLGRDAKAVDNALQRIKRKIEKIVLR